MITPAGPRHGTRRRYPASMTLGMLALVVIAGCTAAHPAAQPAAHPLVSPRKTGAPTVAAAKTPTALPVSCHARPTLAPVGTVPPAPTGFQLLNWVRPALGAQFPTVWGGLTATGPQGLQLVFQETVHDSYLENEVTQHFPRPLFQLVPYSAACLQDVTDAISSKMQEPNEPLQLVSVGIGKTTVEAASQVCDPTAADTVIRWFRERYGSLVDVTTCQPPAVAVPATAPVRRHPVLTPPVTAWSAAG